MILTLEIPSRVFEGIERAAREQGVPIETFAVSVLEPFAARDKSEAARLAAVDAGLGMFAGRGRTVDDFLAERHAEAEADYMAGLERQKVRGQAT